MEIKVALVRKDMSGRQLAAKLGVSSAWISYRLSGKQPIDLNDLERIAAALEVSISELMPKTAGISQGQTTGPKVTLTEPRVTTARTRGPSSKARIRGPIGGPRSSDIAKCNRPIAPGQRRPERLNDPSAITACVVGGTR